MVLTAVNDDRNTYRTLQTNEKNESNTAQKSMNSAKNPSFDDENVSPSSGNAYDLLDMPLFEKMRREKDLSYQDIADEVGTSEPTIRRFFHSGNKNPSFFNVYQITKILGIPFPLILKDKPTTHNETALPELLKMKDQQIKDLTEQRDRYRDHFKSEIDEVRRLADERLKEKQKNMESQAEVIKSQSKTITRQTMFICIGLVVVVMLILIDILFGNTGWIRYDGGLQNFL